MIVCGVHYGTFGDQEVNEGCLTTEGSHMEGCLTSVISGERSDNRRIRS